MLVKYFSRIAIGLGIIVGAGLYSYFSQGLKFAYLDTLFLDLRSYITAPHYKPEHIISINISPLKKNGEQSFDSFKLIEVIRQMRSWGASMIVVAPETYELEKAEEFASWVRDQKDIYLFSTWGKDGAFYSDERFKHIGNHLILKPTADTVLGPHDKKERRFVISLDAKELDPDLTKFNNVIPMIKADDWSRLPGMFQLFTSKQIFIRYYKMDTYPEILINEATIISS